MKNHLLNALVSAALSPTFEADPALQQVYNDQRLVRATKALRARNIFLYTEGTRTSTDPNNVNTIYTQSAGVRLLVLGYSDNMRYGVANVETAAGPNPVSVVFPQMHRVRIVGPQGERVVVDDFVPAQAGVSGQPRYTETRLTVPITLEANEQIAIDLGYDQTMAAFATIPPQAFTFFCVRVKENLASEDMRVLEDVKSYIAAHPFQRSQVINCSQLNSVGTGLNNASAAGLRVNAETFPANAPILITGIGSNLQASRITIIDTRDGTSFSLNRPMQSSALNMPGYEDNASAGTSVMTGAPAEAPLWTGVHYFPMPHLLARGAQLKAEIVNGGDAGGGTNTVTEREFLTQLVFIGVTV